MVRLGLRLLVQPLRKTTQSAVNALTGKKKKKKPPKQPNVVPPVLTPSGDTVQQSQVPKDLNVKPPAVTLDSISEDAHANKDVTVGDGSPSADGSNLTKDTLSQDGTQAVHHGSR